MRMSAIELETEFLASRIVTGLNGHCLRASWHRYSCFWVTCVSPRCDRSRDVYSSACTKHSHPEQLHCGRAFSSSSASTKRLPAVFRSFKNCRMTCNATAC